MDVLSFIPKGIVKNTADRNAEVGQCLDIHNLVEEFGSWSPVPIHNFKEFGKGVVIDYGVDWINRGNMYIQILQDARNNVLIGLKKDRVDEISNDLKTITELYSTKEQELLSITEVNNFIIVSGSEKNVYIYRNEREKELEYVVINLRIPVFYNKIDVIEKEFKFDELKEKAPQWYADVRKDGFMRGYVLLQLYLRMNDNNYVACSEVVLLYCGDNDKDRILSSVYPNGPKRRAGRIKIVFPYDNKTNQQIIKDLRSLKKAGILRDVVVGISADVPIDDSLVSLTEEEAGVTVQERSRLLNEEFQKKLFETNQFYYGLSIDINAFQGNKTTGSLVVEIGGKHIEGEEGSRQAINIDNYLNLMDFSSRVISYNNRAHYLQFRNLMNPIQGISQFCNQDGICGKSPSSVYSRDESEGHIFNVDLLMQYFYDAKIYKFIEAPEVGYMRYYMILGNMEDIDGNYMYVGNTAIDSCVGRLTHVKTSYNNQKVIVRLEYNDGRFYEYYDHVCINESEKPAAVMAMKIVPDFTKPEIDGGYVIVPPMQDIHDMTIAQFTEWMKPVVEKYFHRYEDNNMYDDEKKFETFCLNHIPAFAADVINRIVIYRDVDRRPVGIINAPDIKPFKNMNQAAWFSGCGAEETKLMPTGVAGKIYSGNEYEPERQEIKHILGFLVYVPTFVWSYIPAGQWHSVGQLWKYNDIDGSNRMQVSEYENPMSVSPIHSYRFGDRLNKLLMAATVTGQITETKFGQYPLYVFSSNGIYTIEQGNGDVLYARVNEVCGHVINNPDCVIEIEGGVMFTTDEGIYILNGRQYEVISRELESNNVAKWKAIDDLLNEQRIIRAGSTIHEVLKSNCCAMFDWFNKEIILFSKGSAQMYVKSLRNGTWTTRDSGDGLSFQGIVGNKMIFGYKYVPKPMELASNYHFISRYEDVKKGPRKVLLVSRPMRYGEISRIERVITRMNAKKKEGAKDISFRVFGSGNGADYDVLNGFDSPEINNTWIHRMPCSCRYYIFVIAGEVDHFELTEIQAEIRPMYNNRLR